MSNKLKRPRKVSTNQSRFLTRKEDDGPRRGRTSSGQGDYASRSSRSSRSAGSEPRSARSRRPRRDRSEGSERAEYRSTGSSSRKPRRSRNEGLERTESRSERSEDGTRTSRGSRRGGNRRFDNRGGSRRGNQSRRGNFGGNRGGRGRSKQKKRGQDIDISLFVKKASDQKPVAPTPIKHQFADFDLCAPIQKNLKLRNFETPTPIQDQSIPHILKGRDVIGLANTGTGKTGAFLLPLINKVFNDKKQKVLIIAPTRELANQIEVEFKEFAKHMGIYSCVCIGGAPIFRQIKSLKRRPHFIIGTPGRIKDLHQQKVLHLNDIHNVVLDEVDRMLDMGFVHEIREILSHVPKERQSLFFSATMPEPIKKLVHEFLQDPVTIEIAAGKTTDNVEQDIVEVDSPAEKFDVLSDILIQPGMDKVLIFSETKRGVEKLTRELIRSGFKADSIHGDKRQRQREKSLEKFAQGRVNILVATDVAARGLDIKEVTHVINYTIPQTYDDYVHRIGRTGRANHKGHALTFVV